MLPNTGSSGPLEEHQGQAETSQLSYQHIFRSVALMKVSLAYPYVR